MEQNLRYTRFKDSKWFEFIQGQTALVGGAGGTGSHLIFNLGRIGMNILVYDFDVVDELNLAGQLFRNNDVGKTKVDAVGEIIAAYSNSTIVKSYTKYNNNVTNLFMFSCFDNMEARKTFYDAWKKDLDSFQGSPLLIDARLEYNDFQIYAVTPDNLEEYEKTFFDDSELEDAPCTLKQTTYLAAICSGMMTNLFINHCSNIVIGYKILHVPFKTTFNSPLIQLENE